MFKEWSRSRYHTGTFLPVSKIDDIVANSNTPGYASLFTFTSKPSSASGLGGFEVSANCVALDLDGGDAELAKAEEILQAREYAYEVWLSGGKGYHVMIPHSETRSIHLPHSHKVWVEKEGLPNDPTLYQHGRLFSLPGNVHPNTGKRKELVKSFNGRPAEIEIVEAPTPKFNFKELNSVGIKTVLFRLLHLCDNQVSAGGRHLAIWQAAMDIKKAGLSFEFAEELLQGINEQWPDPKSEGDVRKAVLGAYRK